MKHHFFIEPEQIRENTALLTGSDVNHIKNVLRMRAGEEIVLSDGSMQYNCCITSLEPDRVIVSIQSAQKEEREPAVDFTLYQGIPKGERMELLIQKSVELGVRRIVPVMMERTIVRLDGKKAGQKRIRWQAVAENAARQSGRGIIPQVEEAAEYSRVLAEARELDHFFLAYELAEGMSGTREAFSRIKPGEKVGILIGPEGGISHDEASAATAHGAVTISLGRRILRTETAGPAVLAMLNYVLEQ